MRKPSKSLDGFHGVRRVAQQVQIRKKMFPAKRVQLRRSSRVDSRAGSGGPPWVQLERQAPHAAKSSLRAPLRATLRMRGHSREGAVTVDSP